MLKKKSISTLLCPSLSHSFACSLQWVWWYDGAPQWYRARQEPRWINQRNHRELPRREVVQSARGALHEGTVATRSLARRGQGRTRNPRRWGWNEGKQSTADADKTGGWWQEERERADLQLVMKSGGGQWKIKANSRQSRRNELISEPVVQEIEDDDASIQDDGATHTCGESAL